jgi:SGNH domain (fused to AT3 domains)
MAQVDRHLDTDWRAISDRLIRLGVTQVILMGPVPRWRPSLPEVVATHYWDSPTSKVAEGLEQQLAEIDRTLKDRTGGIRGFTYVSVIDRLCDADGCVGVLPGSADRDLLTFDAGHLTPKGSLFAAAEVLRPVLAPRP